MKKMMKNLMILLLLVAAAYGTKPRCHELTDTVVLKDDVDICDPMAGILTVGNPFFAVTMDFSQADETTVNTFLAKFNKMHGTFVMDVNEQVTTLNFGSIAEFDTVAAPGGMLMLIHNNPKLAKIDWNSAMDVHDRDVVMLVYNNPLLDATSLDTLRSALDGKKKIKHHIQSAGECQFEHPLDPADPAKYIAPSAKLLENCKTIKGDFVVKDVSLAGLGHEINLDPSGCLKLINVDMKGVKLAASNYTGTGACKDGTMSEITGNPNLCGVELEKLHSSYGNNTAVKADPATCTVPCTPDQQSSQGIYFFCLPSTPAETTTTTEPPTNTTNPAAALIGQPTPDPPKDNTEKSFTMEPWMIGTIVVCAVAFLILIGVLGFCWWKKKWCGCCSDDPEIASEPKKVDVDKDKEDKKLTSKEKPGSEEVVPGNRAEDHVEPHGALVMDTTQSTTKTHTPVKPERNEDLKSPANLTGKTKAQEDMVQKPVEEKETKASKEKDDPVKTGTTESKVNVVLEENKKMTPKPKKEEQPDALDDHGADLNVEPTQCSVTTRSKKNKNKTKKKKKQMRKTAKPDVNVEPNLEKNKNVTPKTTKELLKHIKNSPGKSKRGRSKNNVALKKKVIVKALTEEILGKINREFNVEPEVLVNEDDENDPLPSRDTVVNRFKCLPEHIDNYNEFIKSNAKKMMADLRKEHEKVKRCHGTQNLDWHKKMFSAGHARYEKVCPQEDNLVLVKNGSYYSVNKLDSMNKLIYAAEGPTNKSKGTFWRLLVQEKIPIDVMLTGCEENGIEKCYEYYPTPDKPIKTFDEGNIKVTFLWMVSRGKTIRQSRLRVEIDGVRGAHYLDHIQFTAWPDQDVPAIENWIYVLYLLDVVNMLGKTKPMLVHCSAGIGRTGAFIALYIIMEKLKNGELPNVNEVFKFVRKNRAYAIMRCCQYFFIHGVPMLQFLIDGVIEDREAAIAFINDVMEAVAQAPAIKPSHEKPSNEKPSKEKSSKERSKKKRAVEKVPVLEKVTGKPLVDNVNDVISDKGSADKGSADKGSADKGSADKGSVDKGSANKGSADENPAI